MRKLILVKFAIFSGLGLILQACGGAADGNDSNISNGAIGPHTIVVSIARRSISNEELGFYRISGKAIVTDSEGNAIPNVTIGDNAGEYISGNTIYDLNPTLGDGTTPTGFDSAYIIRNNAYRFIQPGDHILMTGLADEEDKRRYVDSSVLSNNLVHSATTYSQQLPNTIYPTLDYIIGSSNLGVKISGISGTADYAITDANGIAEFNIIYPAKTETIRTGCSLAQGLVDERHLPFGSSNRNYIVAWVNDSVTTVSTDFCFGFFADGSIEASPASVSQTTQVTIIRRDNESDGDGVILPYYPISWSTSDAGISVTVIDGALDSNGNWYTPMNGKMVVEISAPSGTAGDVVFDGGEGKTATVSVAIP